MLNYEYRKHYNAAILIVGKHFLKIGDIINYLLLGINPKCQYERDIQLGENYPLSSQGTKRRMHRHAHF